VANGKKKNLTMLISFCIGAVLFVSTAFADVVSKTGYEQFKDAIKNTVGSLAEEYDSFTTETGLSVKIMTEYCGKLRNRKIRYGQQQKGRGLNFGVGRN